MLFKTAESYRETNEYLFADNPFPFVKFIRVQEITIVERGRAARSARRAHNPQVCGSNPHPAICNYGFSLDNVSLLFSSSDPMKLIYPFQKPFIFIL